jgi:hypothetical protein
MYVGIEEGFKDAYPDSPVSRARHIAIFLIAALTPVTESKAIIGPYPDASLDAPYTAALWMERPMAQPTGQKR